MNVAISNLDPHERKPSNYELEDFGDWGWSTKNPLIWWET